MNHPFQALDRILLRAGSLDRFLSDSVLRQEYFESAAEFFGPERFPRVVYDFILLQLAEMNERIPDIGARLWKSRRVFGELSVRVNARSFGRGISDVAWKEYLQKWISGLTAAQGEPGSAGEVKNVDDIRAVIADATARIEAFESRIARLSGRQKRLERVEFFRKMRAEKPLRAAAACLLRIHLTTNPGRNVVRCGDPDLLLHELERWRQHPERVGRQYIKESTRPLASLIRALIPKRSELLGNARLFPPIQFTTRKGRLATVGGTSKGEYRFVPVARPFHAIWRGLYLHECVSGCEADLKSNHPARWAIPAIEGALTVFVTSVSGRSPYQGYIQFVPIRGSRARFLSMELQATVLAKTVLLDPRRPELSGTLFHHWFRKMGKRKIAGSDGFVISDSFDANEAGCSECLRASVEYALSEVVGEAREFRVDDPVAESLANAFPKVGNASHYPRGLIFDANLPDSGCLRSLFASG